MMKVPSCEPPMDDKLQVENKSQRTIIVESSTDSILKRYAKVEYYYLHQIKPNDIQSLICRGGWDRELLRSYNNKLNLYFFDVDTLKKYSNMDLIVYKNLCVKQVAISKEEIEKNNWKVVYSD